MKTETIVLIGAIFGFVVYFLAASNWLFGLIYFKRKNPDSFWTMIFFLFYTVGMTCWWIILANKP